MDPLQRSANVTYLSPEEYDLLPKSFLGMGQIRDLLWKYLVKPTVVRPVYRRSAGKMTTLHFALVGKPGSGRRTAVRIACATCCMDMLTIHPNKFRFTDMCWALQYAFARRPCVIYFDAFELLQKNREFMEDFLYQLYNSIYPVLDGWDGVWFVFALQSEGAALSPPVSDLCSDRFACVEEFSPPQLEALFFTSFLPTGGAVLAKGLTEEQRRVFLSAIESSTPGELRNFAGEVQSAALCRVELECLAMHNNIKFLRGKDTSSRSLPASYWGKDSALSSGSVPTTWKIQISWELDAEPLYVVRLPSREDPQPQPMLPRRSQNGLSLETYKSQNLAAANL
jgi:hypothetical protein